MDIIRRNTDYALRAAVELAGRFNGGPAATREVAESQDIPYQLACKLLQRLHRAGLLQSAMGPRGGFALARHPSKVTVLEVIGAIQGPVSINRCLLAKNYCCLSRRCAISVRLAQLQEHINGFLDALTLEQLAKATRQKHGGRRNVSRSRE